MDAEEAEYFRRLAAQNSAKSVAISQTFAKISTQQLAFLIDRSASISKFNNRVKTQNADNHKRRNKTAHNEDKDYQYGEKMYENWQSEPITLNQIIEQQQKLLNKLQNQLANLKITKKLCEFSIEKTSNTLQKLKLEKQIAMCIRKERELIKSIDEVNKTKVQKIEEYQKQQAEIKSKKEQIAQRLRRLKEQKGKRQEMLSAKSLPVVPKYKLMEKKFVIQEIKHQIDQNVKSKRLKEKRYRNYLRVGNLEQSRLKRAHTENSKLKNNVQNEKSLILQSIKQRQQKKSQFLKQLEEKRRQKIIQIDRVKQLQVSILKDKEKNPLKYNFLKLKNLTEEQIFRDFQDYQLNFDPKERGNQYLQESKLNIRQKIKNLKEDEVNKSGKKQQLQVSLTSKNRRQGLQHQRIRQKRTNSDNLQQEKPTNQNKYLNFKEEIYKLLRTSQSKSKVLELLAQDSNKKQKNMVHLQEELQNSKEYTDAMKIQKNIDADYLQFLKAKIIALKMQIQS